LKISSAKKKQNVLIACWQSDKHVTSGVLNAVLYQSAGFIIRFDYKKYRKTKTVETTFIFFRQKYLRLSFELMRLLSLISETRFLSEKVAIH
jgi:hypothetical protein